MCGIAKTSMPCCALIFQVGPEVFRVDRVEGRERNAAGLVLEEHVAVHVRAVRDRGPFIGVERGELARLVVLVGRLDERLPHGRAQLGRDVFRHRLAGDEAREQLFERGRRPSGSVCPATIPLAKSDFESGLSGLRTPSARRSIPQWSVIATKSYGVRFFMRSPVVESLTSLPLAKS